MPQLPLSRLLFQAALPIQEQNHNLDDGLSNREDAAGQDRVPVYPTRSGIWLGIFIIRPAALVSRQHASPEHTRLFIRKEREDVVDLFPASKIGKGIPAAGDEPGLAGPGISGVMLLIADIVDLRTIVDPGGLDCLRRRIRVACIGTGWPGSPGSPATSVILKRVLGGSLLSERIEESVAGVEGWRRRPYAEVFLSIAISGPPPYPPHNGHRAFVDPPVGMTSHLTLPITFRRRSRGSETITVGGVPRICPGGS